MRALIQRVSRATCHSGGIITGSIEAGLLIFLGIRSSDTSEDTSYLVRKLQTLKLFEDTTGKFQLTLPESKGSILLISQFTLYGSLKKGTKPDFSKAMQPQKARAFFDDVTAELKQYFSVATGSFGNYMQITSVNEGPVSFMLTTDHLKHHD
ncbi:MAG: D-tyrosyl-tRNA(Tyr) deacylase [candidate division WS6 bacterium OLB20]|uniref:D-aminoacyl-tRNA deacylase n=1 Tax=candidate division WS6 bacterium OLB20 TaxID=1617426 RepID=A0A136LXT1_9BACT|nr:MAG: D-tyrosyl-tRNA(Tyr) deacylase [candidate division WS6 bacterium OLB20]